MNTNELKDFKKVASFQGIDIFLVSAGKFKTNTINIFFQDPLTKERAAKNALFPAVLKSGCERLPTYRDIALYLEELYGSVFDCGVTKKGERQILQFYIEYISEKYTDSNERLFEKSFSLLYDIITKPFLEKGVFSKAYVEIEKQNMVRLIQSRINDKTQYGIERCFEEMCKDEPFGIYDYGAVEDMENITQEALYAHYTDFIETCPMQVFITGDVEEEKLSWMIEMLQKMKRGSIKEVKPGVIDRPIQEVKNIEEKLNVTQGKLSLGFRTGIAANDPRYYALTVCNGILGGGIHSKLFQNVREKESLAYYAFSRLEKFKGLMIIGSGIEINNRDKVVDIALQQLKDIQEGKISDYEYQSTQKTMDTGIQSLKDSQLQMVDFYLSQVISGTNDSLDTIIEKIKKVTISEVIEVAKSIKLDTVYFLTAAEGGKQ